MNRTSETTRQNKSYFPSSVLKWAGGKRALLSAITELVPPRFSTYYEPFVGGGAVFFALRPEKATIGDLNPELIHFYRELARDWRGIHRRTSILKNDATTYYRERSSSPSDAVIRASRFLYLNRTCYNGLYRTNRAGVFNVPFGKNGRKVSPPAEALQRASQQLAGTKICCDDFEITCADAKRGDFVFLDPPYTVAHENNGFVKYNSVLFTWEDQKRLARVIDSLTRKGVKILLTNAAHGSIRLLYRNLQRVTVERLSLLGGEGSRRGEVKEYLFTNYAADRFPR